MQRRSPEPRLGQPAVPPGLSLSCPARELARALAVVARIVPRRTALPVLGQVLLEASAGRVALTTTDLEVGVRKAVPAEVARQGATAVPARLLADLVAALPEERVTMQAGEDAMTISSGRLATTLQTIPAQEFPPGPWPEGGGRLVVPAAPLLSAIEQVRPAISTDEARPALTGALLRFERQRLTLVATDGHRLVVRHLDGVEGRLEASLVVPGRALGELRRAFRAERAAVEVLVSPTRSQVLFRSGDTEVCSLLLDGQFPDHERVVPAAVSATALLDRAALVQAVKAVALCARSGSRAVRLCGERGTVRLTAEAAGVGDAAAVLEARLTGDEFQLVLNARYLLDAVTAVGGDEVELRCAGPLAPGLVRSAGSDDCRYAIMPVRLAKPAAPRRDGGSELIVRDLPPPRGG